MEDKGGHPIDWELLTRYVSGSCTEEEEIVVETWAASDPSHRQHLRELQRVWEEMGQWEGSLPVDTDASWKDLNRRIREMEGEPAQSKQPRREGDRQARRRRQPSRSRRTRRRGWAAAAPLMVIAVTALTFLVFDGLPVDLGMLKETVYTTQRGQRAVVKLTDGTEVRLNVDSRLVLPNGEFSEDRRQVRLEGEAYFDVARDTSRPFQVRAGDASIRVLGTAFNVEAYPDDIETRVAVEEGGVSLRSGQTEAPDSVLLTAYHLGVIANRQIQEVQKGADLLPEMGWTEEKLVFRNASFDDVLRRLGRWFDLDIQIQVDPGAVDRLNATLDGKSPDETLKAVAAALELRYRREAKTVVFYREEQGAVQEE
jgi:ferric-dicitrate binding protein FerR (iron transport regulator)